MQINVGTPTLKLLGCSGMIAVETGMCGLVRRLLIGCLLLLSGRLYCCSSERKSRGERIISQLIPTLPILHHSLPQLLIYRRVNFFSLCPFIFGYKLHVSSPPLPDRPALSLLFHWNRTCHRRSEWQRTCCEIPRRRCWHFLSKWL